MHSYIIVSLLITVPCLSYLGFIELALRVYNTHKAGNIPDLPKPRSPSSCQIGTVALHGKMIEVDEEGWFECVLNLRFYMIIKYHKEHRAHKRRTLYDSASTTNTPLDSSLRLRLSLGEQ